MTSNRLIRLALGLALVLGLSPAYAGGGGGNPTYPMSSTSIPAPQPTECQLPAMSLTDPEPVGPAKVGMKVTNPTSSALTEFLVVEVVTGSGTKYAYVEVPVAANSTRTVHIQFLTLYSSATFHLCPDRPISAQDDLTPIVSASSTTPLE